VPPKKLVNPFEQQVDQNPLKAFSSSHDPANAPKKLVNPFDNKDEKPKSHKHEPVNSLAQS